jgi:hypothetical protein
MMVRWLGYCPFQFRKRLAYGWTARLSGSFAFPSNDLGWREKAFIAVLSRCYDGNDTIKPAMTDHCEFDSLKYLIFADRLACVIFVFDDQALSINVPAPQFLSLSP